MKLNRAIIAHNAFYADIVENEQAYYPFNEDTTKIIQENKAVAATDVSSKEVKIGEAQIITGIKKKFEINNNLNYKK